MRDISGASVIRALILFIWTPLLEPNHLPRDPSLIHHHGVKNLTYKIWGRRYTNIQTIAGSDLKIWLNRDILYKILNVK